MVQTSRCESHDHIDYDVVCITHPLWKKHLYNLSPIITRIGEQKTYTSVYYFLMMVSFIYTMIIYISYAFFFGGILPEDMFVTILFMILNLIVTFIETTFIYLQIGQKKNFIYLALPIFMNFLFHIVYTKLF